MDQHPLVLGAIGLAIGAALAAVVRPTEAEARLVGDTSDQLKRRARELAVAHYERAQTIAERAYEAGWNEAREQGRPVEGVPERAAEFADKLGAVARRANQAAKEEVTG